MGCESRVDLSELLRVFGAVFLLDDPGAEAIRTESVQDGSLKATHRGHLWVNVERISIVAETVQECLALLSGFLLDEIRGALRSLWELLSDLAFVSEAADSANKET